MFKVKYGFTAIKASILIAVIAILIVLVGVWYVSKNKAGADVMPYNSRVYGSVVDQANKPITGALVSATVYPNSGVVNTYPKGNTDSSGKFSFTLVGPVNVGVEFDHPDYYAVNKAIITISNGVQYNLGKVIMQNKNFSKSIIKGKVTDQLNNPLSNVSVSIFSASGFYPGELITKNDGTYTSASIGTNISPGLPAGKYTVYVSTPGQNYPDGSGKKTVIVGVNQTVTADFIVKVKLAVPK